LPQELTHAGGESVVANILRQPVSVNQQLSHRDTPQSFIRWLSEFRKDARFWRKLTVVSALTVLAENVQFARIAQNYAVRVSEFVRNGHTPPTSQDRARIVFDCWAVAIQPDTIGDSRGFTTDTAL